MIYLLNTSMLVIKDSQDVKKNEAISILKIGYSKDDRGEGRFQDYISSGLVIYPIKTIPGGSLRLEGELQKKYRHLSIPGRSREWFYMSDEILDDFSKCSSETDLYQLLGVDNEGELIKKIYEESFDSDRKRNILEIQILIDQFKLDYPDKLDSNTYRLLEEFKGFNSFPDQIRLVCSNLSDRLFLRYIPTLFRDYSTILGTDRCRSLRYRSIDLKREYDRLINNQTVDVDSQILSRFNVGSKYSLSDVKSILADIFKDSGYKESPKATILGKYFNLKAVKFTVKDESGDSIKVNGYLILGKKNN